MDLYILDDVLRRRDVVDLYESLIWTERYSEAGDFELVIKSDRGIRELFSTGTHLAIKDSCRVMTVDTLNDGVSSEGVPVLKITGPSIEKMLDDRVAMPAMDTLTVTPKWVLTGTPGNIARAVFQKICVDGVLDAKDILPFYMPGSIFPAGNIAEFSNIVTVELEVDSVYNSVKKLCDINNLGFRLVKNLDTSQLYFDVYTGNDRTTLQTIFAPVVFSPELDTLSNTSELTSTSKLKNIAYVFSEQGSLIVYGENIDPTISGFDRRVLMVNATDVKVELPETAEEKLVKYKETTASNLEADAVTQAAIDNAAIFRAIATAARTATNITRLAAELVAITPLLKQRGKEELAKCRIIIGFDGEIPKSGAYKYGTDYNLGDLVVMRNVDGLTSNMRVTEQIFISDSEGERSYPTLSLDLVITAGSWYGWKANSAWDNATDYWQDA